MNIKSKLLNRDAQHTPYADLARLWHAGHTKCNPQNSDPAVPKNDARSQSSSNSSISGLSKSISRSEKLSSAAYSSSCSSKVPKISTSSSHMFRPFTQAKHPAFSANSSKFGPTIGQNRPQSPARADSFAKNTLRYLRKMVRNISTSPQRARQKLPWPRHRTPHQTTCYGTKQRRPWQSAQLGGHACKICPSTYLQK